jgi:ABC-2 type transport system permease protein
MNQSARLLAVRLRMLRHAGNEFLHGSKLRLCVVVGLLALFWALMFGMFLDVFIFVRGFREISDVLLDYLFSFFFLSLLVMMTISNAIIAYTSLYRSEETEFLMTLPLPAQSVFAYRGADSIVFSLWGMGTLIVPMILAHGLAFGAPAYYYPAAVVLAALFIALATELGAAAALLVATFLPRRRKTVLAALGGACAAALAAWVLPLWAREPEELFSDATIRSVMDRIAFCQHWALPSSWVSRGLLCAGRGLPREAVFLGLVLLSNVLFVAVTVHRAGFYLYRRGWENVQGSSTKRRYGGAWALERALQVLLFPLSGRLRQLVGKDVKTFLREPAQWSQFLLFFGLLGLYVLSLPRFGIKSLETYWHSLIAVLNLAATCLTLATLTTRFVFPQLSLEGRRIWVTGLLPMPRTLILWSKFAFASAGTFVVSAALITLSDLVIGLPAWMLAVRLLVVACVCCGLNGMAVGLGALYPRLGTDSPAKIVSSFGGTLNLVCSICFIMLAVTPVAIPLHLHMLGLWKGGAFAVRLLAGLAVVVGVSLAACALPMWAGARAFSRMEF